MTSHRLLLALLLAAPLPAAETTAPSVSEAPAHTAVDDRAFVDDSAGLLASEPAAIHDLAARLAAFERASGIRIHIRFQPASPSAAEDEKPGVFMRTLSTRLGLEKGGVLAVYFADENDWRLWLGDDVTGRFAGVRDPAAPRPANSIIHNAKEALFAAAEARARTTLPPETEATPARRLAVRAGGPSPTSSSPLSAPPARSAAPSAVGAASAAMLASAATMQTRPPQGARRTTAAGTPPSTSSPAPFGIHRRDTPAPPT